MNNVKTIIISSSFTLLIVSIFFTVFYFVIFAENNKINAAQVQSSNYFYNPNDTSGNYYNNSLINESRHTIVTKTVQKISPAVVGINVTEIRQYVVDPWARFFSNDPFYKHFFGDGVYNKQVKSLGSGAIISSDGYIITNDHVAGNGVKIIVTMTDGNEYDAKIIGSDPVSDITLLKIDAENLPFIPLGNSDDILIGEWVIALGNPFGLFEKSDKPTVTVGVVSATGMNLDPVENRFYLNMIQTDAAINGGNSGGPLVNSVGELIGMNTLIYSPNGAQGNVGVGFAIPINKVKRIMNELKEKGEVNRKFKTGLRIQSIDESIAKYYNLKSTRGVIITHILKNSAADKAGLLVGDIITEVNNYRINNETTMIGAINEFRTGDKLQIKIYREDKYLTKTMKLEEQ
ncbi:MAG: PDZ domain-containing protein [Ignavibacteria bacterium]|nr:PDZ domain-containing protein [Ignavibacteria bacterium]